MGLSFSYLTNKKTTTKSLSDELDDSVVQIPIEDLGELTIEPTAELTVEPPVQLTVEPPVQLTVEPTAELTVEPPVQLTVEPPVQPTVEQTVQLTVELTVEPPVQPTVEQTVQLTVEPTVEPPVQLTVELTVEPPVQLTVEPPVQLTVEPPVQLTVEQTSISERIFSCPLCKVNSKIPVHGLRKCKKFFEYKKNLNKSPYIIKSSTKLNQTEEQGFCAAGIVPYSIIDNSVKILGLVESRDNSDLLFQTKFNFIGGGREAIKINKKIRSEECWETAYAEFSEELGELITKESFNEINQLIQTNKSKANAFWSPKSKMALFGINIGNNNINLELKKDLDITKTEAQSFQWIDLNEWSTNTNIHEFCKQIITDIELTGATNDFFSL